MADLAYKTRRLVESSVTQEGLGQVVKTVTFDVKTLEGLRGEKGSDEGKVFNLVRGLQKEIDDESDAAPELQSLRDRAERILKDLESRNTTGLAAMDLLAARRARAPASRDRARGDRARRAACAARRRLHEHSGNGRAGFRPPGLVPTQRYRRPLIAASFSLAIEDLADQDKRFQDFVIVHELLHLRVQNHGRLFKALMSLNVPGWQAQDFRRLHTKS